MHVCGDVAYSCVCSLQRGHDGPHHCMAATIYDDEECGGMWTRGPFTVHAWPAAARHGDAPDLPDLPFVEEDMDEPQPQALRGGISYYPPPSLEGIL